MTDCPCCGGALAPPSLAGPDRLLGVPGHWAVAVCSRCGSGVTLPREADLAAFYPRTYAAHDATASALIRLISTAVQRLQFATTFRRAPLHALKEPPPNACAPKGPRPNACTRRVLDVGCGRGDLGHALRRRGWRVDGIDPSPAACAAARARGVDARAGTLASVPVEPGAYDAVVFAHSLEHVPDPVADLRRAAAALRPGGLLAITLPNFGCWQRRRFRSRWFHLDLPRHRTHFTPAGLEAALVRAGLQPVRLGTATSVAGLPASIQYALAGRCLFPGGLRLRVAIAACTLTLPVARGLNRLGGGGDELYALARR